MSSTRPNPPQARSDPPASPLGKLLSALLVLISVGVLAGAVLLPEYADLAALRTREAEMTRQLACERRLARYQRRLIRARRTDPVLRAREAIRRYNYTPVGCLPVPTDLGPEVTVPQRIGVEAVTPPTVAPDPWARAGRWLDDPPTRGALVLLSLGMLAVTLVMFPTSEGTSRS